MLFVIVLVASSVLAKWGLHVWFITPKFEQAEQAHAAEVVKHLVRSIDRRSAALAIRCREWGYWDDTYLFASDGNADYVQANLQNRTFETSHLSAFIVCSIRGTVLWGELHDVNDGRRMDSISDAAAFLGVPGQFVTAIVEQGRAVEGFAMTQAGPSLIAACPILHDDQGGPPVGALIIAEPLDARELSQAAGLPGDSVRLLPPENVRFSRSLTRLSKLPAPEEIVSMTLDDRELATYTALADLAGRPALLVEARTDRDLFRQGVGAARSSLLVTLLIGAALFALALLAMNRYVIAPVHRLVGHVLSINRANDLNRRLDDSFEGEFATLAAELNHMMDRLAEEDRQRREIEGRLRLTEEKYRHLFEDSFLGMFQTTPEGRYLSVNNALARIYGYASAEELRGSIDEIQRQVYVDPARRSQFIRQVEEQGTVVGFESQVWRKDGSTCWIVEKARVVRDGAGRVRYYEGTVEDVSQRKAAEAEVKKLLQAVDQSPASIVITDTKGHIEYVNRRFTEISGYTSLEALGEKPSVLKSGQMDPAVYRELWTTIRNGREWRGELQNRHKTGELYWEYASISPIVDADGTITHFLAVKEDITARKASDETLRRTMDQLERFNRLAIGREKRIIELKQMVNRLLARLGEQPQFRVGSDSPAPERVATAQEAK